MTRARSSRKWSPSDIRPPSPTASRGRPRNRSRTPTIDTGGAAGSGGGAGRAAVVRAGGARARGAVVLVDRPLLGGLGAVVVLVVEEALGLGLEGPQRATAAPGQLRQLGGAEEEHQHEGDDDQLGRAEAGDQ